METKPTQSDVTRSRMMSRIGNRNTKPEIQIRRMLHARGFRFRLQRKDLPGRPDIILPKYNAIIFVNGCFWHGHDCHLFRWPKTRPEFWRKKIVGNIDRDRKNISKLTQQGWRVYTVWECSLRGKEQVQTERFYQSLLDWLLSDYSET